MDRRHPARLIRHAAQRTCRRSMRTATAALGTTMSRPSSLAGSHRVSLPISSQGAAKDCALSLTSSGRAAENAGLLKRQHRSRSQRRFPEDALVANVGCRRVPPVPLRPCEGPLTEPTSPVQHLSGERVFVLRVFGRLPVTDSAARSEGRRPKSLRGGNRGGVCGGSGVGLWRFSACVCPHLFG